MPSRSAGVPSGRSRRVVVAGVVDRPLVSSSSLPRTETRRRPHGVARSGSGCPVPPARPIRVAYTPLGRAWLAMRPRSSPVHRTPVAAAGMAFGLSPASHPPNTQLYSIVGQSLQIVSRPKDAWSVFLLPTYPEWTARVQHHLWSQRQCSTCYRLFGGVVAPRSASTQPASQRRVRSSRPAGSVRCVALSRHLSLQCLWFVNHPVVSRSALHARNATQACCHRPQVPRTCGIRVPRCVSSTAMVAEAASIGAASVGGTHDPLLPRLSPRSDPVRPVSTTVERV